MIAWDSQPIDYGVPMPVRSASPPARSGGTFLKRLVGYRAWHHSFTISRSLEHYGMPPKTVKRLVNFCTRTVSTSGGSAQARSAAKVFYDMSSASRIAVAASQCVSCNCCRRMRFPRNASLLGRSAVAAFASHGQGRASNSRRRRAQSLSAGSSSRRFTMALHCRGFPAAHILFT